MHACMHACRHACIHTHVHNISTHFCIHLSTCLSICPSICPSICQSIYLFIYLSANLSTSQPSMCTYYVCVYTVHQATHSLASLSRLGGPQHRPPSLGATWQILPPQQLSQPRTCWRSYNYLRSAVIHICRYISLYVYMLPELEILCMYTYIYIYVSMYIKIYKFMVPQKTNMPQVHKHASGTSSGYIENVQNQGFADSQNLRCCIVPKKQRKQSVDAFRAWRLEVAKDCFSGLSYSTAFDLVLSAAAEIR